MHLLLLSRAVIIMRRGGTEIWDHTHDLRLTLHGRVGPCRVYVYDGDYQRVITGIQSECGLYLTNHRDSTHIDLRVDGSRFEGYDHGSEMRFEGTACAVGRAVSLNIEGDAQYYTYTIEMG